MRRRKGTDEPQEVLRLLGRMVLEVTDVERKLDADRRAGTKAPPGGCSIHPTEDHCRGAAVMRSLSEVGLDVLPAWASEQAAELTGAGRRKPRITMYDVEASAN